MRISGMTRFTKYTKHDNYECSWMVQDNYRHKRIIGNPFFQVPRRHWTVSNVSFTISVPNLSSVRPSQLREGRGDTKKLHIHRSELRQVSWVKFESGKGGPTRAPLRGGDWHLRVESHGSGLGRDPTTQPRPWTREVLCWRSLKNGRNHQEWGRLTCRSLSRRTENLGSGLWPTFHSRSRHRWGTFRGESWGVLGWGRGTCRTSGGRNGRVDSTLWYIQTHDSCWGPGIRILLESVHALSLVLVLLLEVPIRGNDLVCTGTKTLTRVWTETSLDVVCQRITASILNLSFFNRGVEYENWYYRWRIRHNQWYYSWNARNGDNYKSCWGTSSMTMT